MMTDEMTDAEVADQIARADRFAVDFREMVAATVVDPVSPCADAHRRGLQRIADTVVPQREARPNPEDICPR
jgi:hypothetical protein